MQMILVPMILLAYSSPPIQNQAAVDLRMGGCGGLYLLAEPGDLWVDIHKTDLHDGRRDTRLQAILLGPDRRPRDQAIIPQDGAVRLLTKVDRKGVFVVNVTVTQDRYGEHIRWGFDTNAAHYLVETSRGHRDARHMEPIVLNNPDVAGDVCFLPQAGTFQIEVGDLPPGSDPLEVYDGDGALEATLAIDDDGRAAASFEVDRSRRTVPWRLHLPSQRATIHIDGVTRWERHDRFADLSLWSPHLQSFFPFHEHRWLLTPYSRTFYAAPGETRELSFRLHNNAAEADTLTLHVEPLTDWSLDTVACATVAPGEAETVTVRCELPDDAAAGARHEARITVTPSLHPEMTTYSTILAHIGRPPYTEPLDLPLVYQPYEHENEQFGYEPDYPTDSQIYFGADNRPYLLAGRDLHTLREGGWTSSHIPEVTTSQAPTLNGADLRPIGSKIGFDREGDLYLLARNGRTVALLCSDDGGASFSACPVPGREDQPRSWDIEAFTGHNVPDGPPPFLRNTQTQGRDPRHFWRRVNDLELFLPRKEGDRIIIGDPILLSDKAIGISSHSGIPCSIVSRGDRVHIIWGEATDPDEKVPGVPAYVVTYDRQEGLLGEPVFVGWGPPANDVHNTPSITMDSEGYLHTLTGTHGQPFAYARSLEPNTAHGGFTTPELVEENLRSTYIGLVCDAEDTLHLVFRMWTQDGVFHPTSHYANLAYKRKPKDGPWEKVRRLAVAPFSEYSVFYHRLTIDTRGRVFLSFDYWSTYWFYRMDHPGDRRKTIFSADGGERWKLLATDDL